MRRPVSLVAGHRALTAKGRPRRGRAHEPETGPLPAGGMQHDRTRVMVHVARTGEQLDSRPGASNTPGMVDPLVLALAQLVRDRWAAEQAERRARRGRLRVVEGRR